MLPATGFAQDKAKGEATEAECPTRDIDQLIELFKKEPTCRSAIALFELCEYGASGDVPLGAAVTEKCEGDFLSKLSASQKRAYDREMKVCNRKYRNETGSMYRSFEAFCRTYVARKYSDAALKRARPK
jgi:hypothetical protein